MDKVKSSRSNACIDNRTFSAYDSSCQAKFLNPCGQLSEKCADLCLSKTSMRRHLPQTLLLFVLLRIIPPFPSAGIPTHPELEQLYQSAEEAFQHQQWGLAQKLFGRVLAQAYGQRGRLWLLEGRFQLAVSDLERAHKLAPENVAILGELARAHLGNQQFGLAASELEKAAAAGNRNPQIVAALGQAYFSLRKLQLARATLERALRENPADHLTAYTLGLVVLEQKDLRAASHVFSKLRQAVGDSAPFRLLAGRAYVDTGFHEQGDRELRTALALDPRIHFAHFLLGMSALQQGESSSVEEAQRQFEAEIQEHPQEFAPLYFLGVVFESKREWERARYYLEQAEKMEPNDADVHFHLGEVESELGEVAEAAKDLESSIVLSTTASHAHYQRGHAHYLLSQLYLKLGAADKAAEEANLARKASAERAADEREKMSQLLRSSAAKIGEQPPLVTWAELSPSSEVNPDLQVLETLYTSVLANSYNRLGLIATQKSEFDEGVHEFERVAELQPHFPRIDFNVGLAAFRAQRLPKAIAAFTRVLQRDPSDKSARQLLGLAQFEHEDFAAALPNLEEAASETAEPEVLLALGTCLARAGRSAEAKNVFSKLAETHSNLPELHLFLGQAAYAEGRASEAAAELHQALALDPRVSRAHLYLGLIALDGGQLEAAQTEFETELLLYAGDQKTRYHLAYVLLQEQKRAEAIALLRQILQADPGYAEAHYALGKTLVEEGHLRGAIAELETAVRLDPSKAYSHYQLGRAYSMAGRAQDSQREFARARELKDHRPETTEK